MSGCPDGSDITNTLPSDLLFGQRQRDLLSRVQRLLSVSRKAQRGQSKGATRMALPGEVNIGNYSSMQSPLKQFEPETKRALSKTHQIESSSGENNAVYNESPLLSRTVIPQSPAGFHSTPVSYTHLTDRKSTRLNSSHVRTSRMPSSA